MFKKKLDNVIINWSQNQIIFLIDDAKLILRKQNIKLIIELHRK